MEEQNFVQSIMIHNGTWVGTKAENGPWTNNYGNSTFTNFDYNQEIMKTDTLELMETDGILTK